MWFYNIPLDFSWLCFVCQPNGKLYAKMKLWKNPLESQQIWLDKTRSPQGRDDFLLRKSNKTENSCFPANRFFFIVMQMNVLNVSQ
jgi:hypothetical protein